MAVLELRNVVKEFGAYRASNNISFSVVHGRVFGLLGPNGAGKTTLIRMITNILQPDSGEILLEGELVSSEHQNRIGYLPEERGLYKKAKVIEQLAYFGRLKGLSSHDALQRALAWLKRLGAEDWAQRKVQELSKGMQQKVQFIATVLHEPPLLILDEPFSGFDPVNAELLITSVKELQAAGTTIILSTHQMDQVEKLCDDIVLINKGRLVLQGSVREVKAGRRRNNVTLEFHGDGAALETIPGVSIRARTLGRLDMVIEDPTVDPSRILQHAINTVSVTKFEVDEPSINDIFIATVTGADPSATTTTNQ
jgi:ABC-2 type transport system ATP-binding protein